MNQQSYLWSSALQQAIRRNRRDAHNRYLQLATVRPDGSPAVRSLVFRSFNEKANCLHMVTDARSDKVADIAASARGEICWYFSHTREQFRLHGELSLTGPDAADQTLRQTLWASLSEKGSEQFFWPHPKSGVLEDAAIPVDLSSPPATFMALTMHVATVDHLCLRGSPQRRYLSSPDSQGVWQSISVNP